MSSRPETAGQPSIAVAATDRQPAWIPLSVAQPFSRTQIREIQGPDDPSQLSIDTGFAAQPADAFTLNWLSPTNTSQFDWMDQTTAFQTAGENVFGDPFLPDHAQFTGQPTWSPQANSPRPQQLGTVESLDQSPALYVGKSPSEQVDVRRCHSGESAEPLSPSPSTVATLYVEGSVSRAPFRGRSIQRRSAPSIVGLATVDDHPGFSPASEDTADLRSSEMEVLSAQAYENIVQSTRTEVSFQQIRSRQPTRFPSHHQMQAFFRLYFLWFHPSFPFLRPDPAFYEQPSQWLVTLALCVVGSRYCCKSESLGAGHLLSNVFQSIICQSLTDSSFEAILVPWAQDAMLESQEDSALCIMQAAALDLICKTHDGRGRSTHSVLMERYKVVQACRSLVLLGARDSDKGHDGREPHRDISMKAWLKDQLRIRIGYMIWVSVSMGNYSAGLGS